MASPSPPRQHVITFHPAPSLNRQAPPHDFQPFTKILPHPDFVIKVGRWSEREHARQDLQNYLSDTPVGFKSKVVSRKHCELYHDSCSWYIKDVKSSSGTFVNGSRLSEAGAMSVPKALKDGDIVQLGVDFKGGEEMLFRCIRIKVEIAKGPGKSPTSFDRSTQSAVQNLIKQQVSADGTPSKKRAKGQMHCVICLNKISPCQATFVAACSHVWHFKCIRGLLMTPNYPLFNCPNCRVDTNLEADVEEMEEFGSDEETAEMVTPVASPSAQPSELHAPIGDVGRLRSQSPAPLTGESALPALRGSGSSSARRERRQNRSATVTASDEAASRPSVEEFVMPNLPDDILPLAARSVPAYVPAAERVRAPGEVQSVGLDDIPYPEANLDPTRPLIDFSSTDGTAGGSSTASDVHIPPTQTSASSLPFRVQLPPSATDTENLLEQANRLGSRSPAPMTEEDMRAFVAVYGQPRRIPGNNISGVASG